MDLINFDCFDATSHDLRSCISLSPWPPSSHESENKQITNELNVQQTSTPFSTIRPLWTRRRVCCTPGPGPRHGAVHNHNASVAPRKNKNNNNREKGINKQSVDYFQLVNFPGARAKRKWSRLDSKELMRATSRRQWNRAIMVYAKIAIEFRRITVLFMHPMLSHLTLLAILLGNQPTNQPSFWYLPYHALHLGLQRSFLRRRTQPSEVVKLSIGDRGQNSRRSLVPGPWSSMFGLMRQKCLSGEKFYWSLICRHPARQPAASVENRDHFW